MKKLLPRLLITLLIFNQAFGAGIFPQVGVGVGGGTTPSSGLLAYLSGLSSASPPYLVWAQHSDYYTFTSGRGAWNTFSGGTTAAGAYMQGSAATYQLGGLSFALQGPYNGGGAGSTQQAASGANNVITLANAALANGNIVQLSTWLGNPNSGTNCCGAGALPNPTGSCPFPNVITQNGNSIINQYQTNLAAIAAELNSINGTVIYRPFVEINLSGTWWYAPGAYSGCVTNADFVTLWQQTYTYINSLITNPNLTILWNYNVNVEQGNGTYVAEYPGSGYVNIVSFDAYGDTPGSYATSDQLYSDFQALGKPIIISEMGNGSSTAADGTSYATLSANIQSQTSAVVMAFVWCQGWALATDNTAAQITSTLTNGAIVLFPNLPPGVQNLRPANDDYFRLLASN